MPDINKLSVKIFADGADLGDIAELAANPYIQGFTTNPTLMRKAKVQDYRAFALEALTIVKDRPISLEVFSDDLDEMDQQAKEISSWGNNIYVKVPVTNTKGDSTESLVRRLSADGVQVNVTAVFTLEQVQRITDCLSKNTKSIVSVFAGRIADTGVDPMPVMAEAVNILTARPLAELIWASPRELLNIFQADAVGCQIITATPDLLAKLPGVGKDLEKFSLETVQMFRDDAVAAGYSIDLTRQPV